MVKAAQRLGFTLAGITELLDVGSHRAPRPGLRVRAQEKLADVARRIAALQVMWAHLVEVIDAGCADLVACPCVPATTGVAVVTVIGSIVLAAVAGLTPSVVGTTRG